MDIFEILDKINELLDEAEQDTDIVKDDVWDTYLEPLQSLFYKFDRKIR